MAKSAKQANTQLGKTTAAKSPETNNSAPPVSGTVEQGQQIPGVDAASNPDDEQQVTEEQKENAVDAEWLAEKIGPYLEHYPAEKVFHLTTDGQVFLDANKACAVEHQRAIAPGVEMITFSVE